MTFQANEKEKIAEVAILRQNWLKPKEITKDKGHFIMIKGSIQQDITLINIYAPNIAPKYIKQILTDIKRKNYNNSRGL